MPVLFEAYIKASIEQRMHDIDRLYNRENSRAEDDLSRGLPQRTRQTAAQIKHPSESSGERVHFCGGWTASPETSSHSRVH